MAAKGRPISASRSGKVAEKLQEKIRQGSYYEAHQTYRALYQRYNAQRRESEAIELLYEGATRLLKCEQWESGTDLALLMITHFKEKKTPVSEDLLDKISHLFTLYKIPPPSPTSKQLWLSDTDSREIFMRAAIKWTSMTGGEESTYGHPQLHKLLALTYWKEKCLGKARDHFLYASLPEDFGAMLVDLATSEGYPGEADLFVTQAVLQLLVLKNRLSAVGVFTVYTQTHPSFRSEHPPFQRSPLLNFTWFLLLASGRGDGEVYQRLREEYTRAINRDPALFEYLDKVGVAFFGVQPPPAATPAAQTGGGLAGTLGNLLGGLPSFLCPAAVTTEPRTNSQPTLTPVDIVD